MTSTLTYFNINRAYLLTRKLVEVTSCETLTAQYVGFLVHLTLDVSAFN
jgi:hypothetical protein